MLKKTNRTFVIKELLMPTSPKTGHYHEKDLDNPDSIRIEEWKRMFKESEEKKNQAVDSYIYCLKAAGLKFDTEDQVEESQRAIDDSGGGAHFIELLLKGMFSTIKNQNINNETILRDYQDSLNDKQQLKEHYESLLSIKSKTGFLKQKLCLWWRS